ncbi:cell wall hydrolase [Paenibacillus sp. FSL H8-0548]|uniref:cell wall hydrolase n=1 Tax=Paenibacillus sp. FSL H8-0548 TaxID=1920422 RepID=UPI00096E3098|nr:stalk domain-containing protein [Paenibacillus sp. FSL H8-0548]OMF21105.1 cell wall hydrolase [Paenibacillus sp. FSL H8-0548]
MIREGKRIKCLIITILLGVLLLSNGPMSIVSAGEAAAMNDLTLKLDGKIIKMTEPVVTLDGRMYVPAARIAELFGAKSSWDKDTDEVTIHTALNDKIVLGNGVPVVYFNEERYLMDVAPFLKDGRLYVPLRQLSEMLHAKLQLNTEQDIVDLITVQPVVITGEKSLDEIAKELGSSKSELLKRNGLNGKEALKPGTKLNVVIPSIFTKAAKSFTEADYMLLAKITMVEAGYETYQGQLALANVILNRVKDVRFPDSIKEVIYSGKQFPPAHNGMLDKSKPNASVLRAVKDALNGKNNVENAVYFFNPNISKGSFWSSLDVIASIGHHSFAK